MEKKTVGANPQLAKRSKGSEVSSAKKRSEVVPVNSSIPCKNRSRVRDRINNNLYVSTELSLYDQTWPPRRAPPCKIPPEDEGVNNRIREMKYYTPEEEEAERRIGVSTKLKLFTYPWNITKILTPSDLNSLSRLLVPTSLVESYVMPLLDAASRDEVGTDKGLRVTVWDFDTNSSHSLAFKKWSTSNSYVLIDNWIQDFVRRRKLAAGDEIGMCWDAFYSRFHFCVLDRAADAAPAHRHRHQQEKP